MVEDRAGGVISDDYLVMILFTLSPVRKDFIGGLCKVSEEMVNCCYHLFGLVLASSTVVLLRAH